MAGLPGRPPRNRTYITITTTFRALLAIALLVGFYVLVGTVIAATVAFDVLAIRHPNAGAIKLAVATVRAFLARYGVADSHRPARLPQPDVTGQPAGGRR
ncbi:MAG TPA: hypothetical protein VE465_08160 [Streptosporangiaceae bacterium]|jgi:hypothetical protein|nr:hypothetical protein [Streptosporangiaceae bacterium]